MKVLVGYFNAECNENIPRTCDLSDFDIAYGDKCIEKMYIREVFENAGIEIIPSIYANAGACGVIEKDAYISILICFKDAVKKHIHEIDGIYFHLHGASYVYGIGSCDHDILKNIREIVGEYLPIMVSCDPHGNMTKEYVEATTLIRSFRESPHTDNVITYRKVAQYLCDFLKNRQYIHSVYRKLPLILGGEQSVSLDEPVLSINKYMDELEKDPRILSASWHVGYLRHDCPEAGCSIVVVPRSEADQLYSETVADDLAKYVMDRKEVFHYTGLTAQPKEALESCLNQTNKPNVLTDSGDNMTSGATGWNTYVLRQVLESQTNKSILFAPIIDEKTYDLLATKTKGDTVSISLGTNKDKLSKSVDLTVNIKKFGKIGKFTHGIFEVDQADCVVVNIANSNIDIIIANGSNAFINNDQFKYIGVDWESYDLTVLKQGYIFPDFKEKANYYVMSLTDGATPQDTKNIKFKRIKRPMYPIDEI